MDYTAKTYVRKGNTVELLESEFSYSGQDNIRKKASEAMKAKHGIEKVMAWSVPASGESPWCSKNDMNR